MSIDKFGTRLERSLKKNETIRIQTRMDKVMILDDDDQYSAQNKRIKLLNDPLNEKDVVNKSWVERNFLKLQNTFVSMGMKRLSELGEPRQRSDAVTMGYVDMKMTKFKESFEKEIKDKTNGMFNHFEDELRKIKIETSSLNTLLRESIKHTKAALTEEKTK